MQTWRGTEAARVQVTRADVVREALVVLDAEGFDGLTMRRLAERLKIKAASLYNHVSDKNELLTLLADVICEAIPPAVKGHSWRKQLEVLAVQGRRAYLSHRDGARVMAVTPPIGPNRVRIIEQVVFAFSSAGFSKAKVADASFVLNSYLVGFVLDETMGVPVGAAAAKAMREEGRAWFKALPAAQYPSLVSHADALTDSTPDRRFALGLKALLDGFELARR